MQLGDAPAGYRSGFASFVGRPNVGKSTLLNQILRAKVAITSDRPQTTRNAIRGVLTTDDAQVVFVDTPGLHKPRTALGDKLNAVVQATLAEVDAVVFVLDAADGVGSGDGFIAGMLRDVRTPVIVALNKIDLVDHHAVLPQLARAGGLGGFHAFVPVSAKTGEGIPELLDEIKRVLPEGPLYYPADVVTDQPEAMLIAELVREKALRLTHEEVPHSIAVVVEEVRRQSEDFLEVDAVLYVERDSQKGIVIGRRGSMLKRIGTEARSEIEALLGSRVYLHLRVKVERDWQKRSMLVERFGYGS
jgi:GTP-binding protein Era